LNYAESTGTTRFNVTDPGDGDQASCERGRADWEFGTIGHTQFSPLDNLALYGWKRFAESEFLYDRDLGWPLHAIGDAVAPHHVAGTTGWGHRPFEDAAELHWPRIVFLQTLETGDAKRRLQYEQLRRVLAWAFHYALVIDELRAERPLGERQNVIPVRAFITQIGLDTLAETTEPGTGAPRWPFDPTISTPYILDQNLKTQFLTVVYGTEDGIARTRALLERGAGAAASFLSAVWPLTVATLPGAARCDVAQPGAGFFQCGADSSCVGGCCVPDAICTLPCTTGDECDVGASCVNGCCEGGIR
jgi:hypothetical protein